MEQRKSRSRALKVSVGILLFVALLSAARFGWVHTFAEEQRANIIDGELDLRQENQVEDEILALDGMWEFYPSTLIMEEDTTEPVMIQVPGDWSEHLKNEKASEKTYGYGSYRLRILVDPEDEYTYSIRVPSVRSSSQLYVNGKKLENSGTVGKSEDTYVAKNLPYSVYFAAEDGVIDIVLQVANYWDTRSSGLIRSMKFSTQENLTKQTDLSTGLQQIMLVILLLHGLYAVILYFLGNQDKRLIYFALFIFSSMTMFGLGLEEKFLHAWLGIDYTFAFRLSTISLLAIGYFLYKSVQDLLPPLGRKVLIAYEIACLVSAIGIITLPLHVFLEVQEINYVLTLFSFLIATYVVFKVSTNQVKRNIVLLLAFIAFFHNGVWTFALMFNGIKIMYYPFDLIISVMCLAAFWFQQYFETYKEAQRLSLKLQEADKAKDEFIANTSHELRNPLHAILNLSQVVLERETEHIQKESVKELETVVSVGKRMSTMVNDLLDVMVLKEGSPRLNVQPFQIQSITNGVLDMMYYMTEGKNIKLINNLPDDFPIVEADEDRVIQILFNLVHNSIKFTHEGTVSIEGTVGDEKAYISVIDTGIGMDAETIQFVFEPYEQARMNGTIIEGGFGLGLSISKQLTELHKGSLEVESTVGKGSTFTFSLPLADEQESIKLAEVAASVQELHTTDVTEKSPSNQTSVMAERGRTYGPNDCPRILIVDDDPTNLQVVQTVLSLNKYDITTVLNGEDALKVLHKNRWDLVIADVMMPRMSGYALTREIRKRFTITELPVLLLTARVQTKDIEQGFLSGANDYVAKPVDALELRSRVHALTSVRRSMSEHLRMEAAWLQAQIQPHFLFNALNTIMALSEIDPKRMQHVLEAFSDFLRGKFNFQNVDDLTAIHDEIDLIEAYLTIEKERFGDRLHIEWEMDDVGGVYIPPLTIQPLVENAIHHGIMSQVEGGTLRICIKKEDGNVHISVQDDGAGMTEDERAHLFQRKTEGRTGVGLLNTHIRLTRQFNSGLHVESEISKGTTVSFTIPIMDESTEHE